MGLPHRQLFATNTGDPSDCILLTSWKPVKKEDGKYYWPPDTPLGGDIWVPNVLELLEEEGTVPVMVVTSNTETGIWLVCYDDYFGNEQHIYNYRPHYIEETRKIDWNATEKEVEGDNIFGIHISTNIEMTSGDPPIPVTLKRGEYPPREWEKSKKESLWKKIIKIFQKKSKI